MASPPCDEATLHLWFAGPWMSSRLRDASPIHDFRWELVRSRAARAGGGRWTAIYRALSTRRRCGLQPCQGENAGGTPRSTE
jgi:hypothetical protein